MTYFPLFRTHRSLLWGLLIILFCRVVILFSMGMMPQDAYYYYYAQNLALSYYDHPPMIAYMLYIFTSVFGSEVFVIKFADFSVTLIFLFLFYRLAQRILSPYRAVVATVLIASTLMVTILSMVSTPDVPLMMFWTLALIYIHRAISDGLRMDWLLAGILIGLAFDSKYTAVFLLGGLCLFLLTSTRHRSYIISTRSLLLLAGFILTVSPVFIWNFTHDWGSFGFQGSSRFNSIMALRLQPQLILGLLGHQLLILIPVLGVSVLYFISRKIRAIAARRDLSDDIRYLLCFSLPMLLFFGMLSPLYWIKLNWLMPTYVTGIILVAIYVRTKYLVWQVLTSVVCHVLLLAQILWYPVNIKSDDTWWGWDELAAEVETLSGNYPDHFLFSLDGYKTSAMLSYYLSDKEIYSSNVIGENALQFSIERPCLFALRGKSALFFDSEKRNLSPEDGDKQYDLRLNNFFESVVAKDPILIRNNRSQILRKFFVYECRGYRPGCTE